MLPPSEVGARPLLWLPAGHPRPQLCRARERLAPIAAGFLSPPSLRLGERQPQPPRIGPTPTDNMSEQLPYEYHPAPKRLEQLEAGPRECMIAALLRGIRNNHLRRCWPSSRYLDPRRLSQVYHR